ncbi:MAG: hypothetical protein FWD49_04675 [Firmicutes bacterium]|nr:hypothetical protein [Bacillota bacterium]
MYKKEIVTYEMSAFDFRVFYIYSKNNETIILDENNIQVSVTLAQEILKKHIEEAKITATYKNIKNFEEVEYDFYDNLSSERFKKRNKHHQNDYQKEVYAI